MILIAYKILFFYFNSTWFKCLIIIVFIKHIPWNQLISNIQMFKSINIVHKLFIPTKTPNTWKMQQTAYFSR